MPAHCPLSDSRELRRSDHVIGGAQYNFFLHSLPHGDEHKDCGPSYHWHLEIIPILTKVAGFEWGTGFYINPVPPETGAQFLRLAA